MKRLKIEFIQDPNGCFIITSHRPNQDGYCYFRKDKIQKRAHRHIYEECFGEIAEGLVVRHKCDVRNCINPEHMELGTTQENTRDCVVRGRKALGVRTGHNKITDDVARQIKILLREGKKNLEIAKHLSVSVYIVYSISANKSWKHINISA